MGIYKQVGTGRAICRICNKKIEKGTFDIVFRAIVFRAIAERHYHKSCLLQCIKAIYVFLRKPNHRIDYEEQKIEEFKDFILKKFKRYKPSFKEIEVEGGGTKN